MFRKLAIAVITALAALLETMADAIVATLPPPAADSPRLRVVASGRLCLRLRLVTPLDLNPEATERGRKALVVTITWRSLRAACTALQVVSGSARHSPGGDAQPLG